MSDERLRLFVALWPDAAIRRALHAGSRQAVEVSGGRPVPPANYHLTLAFLGLQPRSKLDAIDDAARGGARLEGMLRLTRIGHFSRARVLWAGPERTPPALGRAAARLRSALEANGVHFAPGPFRAHVTLARRITRAPDGAIEPIRWRYAGLALVLSEGGRAPYRVLRKWPEGAPDSME